MMTTTDDNGQPKYQQLILKEPLKSVEFLIQTMGFEPIPADFERAVFVRDKQGNCFKLPLNLCVEQQEPVLIYTDVCLSNYFELKSSGVQIINAPHYTPLGLVIDFADDWGNFYKILEERRYEDNQ